MPVELLGLGVVVQVKVGVAQLAVDGAQHLQVLCSDLDGGFEEGDACSVVAHLTEALALQGQFQAGDLHPAADRSRVSHSHCSSGSAKVRKRRKVTGTSEIFTGQRLQPTDQTALSTSEHNHISFQGKALKQGMLLDFLSPPEHNGSALGSVCYDCAHILQPKHLCILPVLKLQHRFSASHESKEIFISTLSFSERH